MQNPNDDHLALFIDEYRIVKKPEIQRLLGISRSTLGRRIKSGRFPKPSVIENGRSYWLFKNVREWLLK
ncbi:AlpA family phage regulatory protein [Shewanella sp. SG41-3]|uniref:helix-turn-helix transcriptional regulator n=1 Tax=Shewanella sp. SG41-3 TaxID=2760977 RepID=UPI0015FF4EAB|nr:AlpA family phage regulatory protein [Shewanella sp. SG41-3]